jgi:hypothetical protein
MYSHKKEKKEIKNKIKQETKERKNEKKCKAVASNSGGPWFKSLPENRLS